MKKFIGSNTNIYSNSILFTFQKNNHINRNSGFAWEPGAFGGFLIISLFIYLIKNSFKIRKKFWVLLIAAITTSMSSVTGIADLAMFATKSV